MDKEIIQKFIEVLKDQSEIFGEDLFEPVEKFTFEVDDSKASYLLPEVEEGALFMEKNEDSGLCCDAKSLDELKQCMHDCHKCPLEKLRTNLVFGKGNPKADVMVIGEAPGADEDKIGEPFVGRAGKLLTDILKAINFNRDEVYITNIVKCRPPGNRNPLPDEMKRCLPYLFRQIELIKPKMILCLGLVSASGVLNLKQTLTKMRGNIYGLGEIKVMVTYHPAALLRNPSWKKGAWEDVQKFRKLYDEIVSS